MDGDLVMKGPPVFAGAGLVHKVPNVNPPSVYAGIKRDLEAYQDALCIAALDEAVKALP